MESSQPNVKKHPELDAYVSLDFVSIERDMNLIDLYSDRAEAVRNKILAAQPPELYSHVPRLPFAHYIQSLGYMAYIGKNLVLRHYASYLEEKAECIRDVYCEEAYPE